MIFLNWLFIFNFNSSKNKYHKKIIISSIIVFGLLAITIIVLIFTVFNKNSKAVVTVPMEKNEVVDDIIKLASENDGWIGYSICFNKKGMKQILK